MKAFVDKESCIGCGLCEAICPKVFAMNRDNLAEAKDVELDSMVLEEVNEARAQCPVDAISVE